MSFTVDDGWFMASLHHLNIVCLKRRPDDSSFQRFLDKLAADIDAWPVDQPRSVLYEALDGKALTPVERRALGDVLQARRAKLRRITKGYAFVTPSPVVRGAVMAIFWMAPPPYPYRILSSAKEGFDWLAASNEAIDPAVALRHYEKYRRRFEKRQASRLVVSPTARSVAFPFSSPP